MCKEKDNVKYFRTFPSTDHKEGCPNEVEYDDITGKYIVKSYEKRLNISNSHINDTLERAFNKFRNISIKGQNYNRNNKKGYVKKGENTDTISGAELFGEGIESENGKETYIITRMYDEIDKADD